MATRRGEPLPMEIGDDTLRATVRDITFELIGCGEEK